MAVSNYISGLVILLPAFAITACASAPSYNTRGMDRASFGAYKSAESGIALGKAVAELLKCNDGQKQTATKTKSEVRSGSKFTYDDQRRSRYSSRRARQASDPIRQQVFSNVDNQATFTCETPDE